jgi:hypothetical protein
MCVGFGDRLLTQEHVPVDRAAPAGFEPATFPLTTGRTTVVLQSNCRGGSRTLMPIAGASF